MSNTLVAIVTHFRPDLDACLAVWAAHRIHGDLPVEFVPTGNQENLPDRYYVDLTCGVKEGPDGRCAGAYLCQLLPDREVEAMAGIAAYVDAVDRGRLRQADHGDIIGLSATVNAHKEVMTDEQVIEAVGRIFDGFLSIGLKNIRARELAAAAEWVGDVAITRQPAGEPLYYAVADFLPRQPAALITVIGANMGAIRKRDDINLYKLDLPDGWFQHRAGFMCQWGDLSGKGKPADQPPAISAEELAKKINGLI